MYVQVHILNGITEPLWYSVPSHLYTSSLCGRIVHVPVRTKSIPGLVVSEHTEKPKNIRFTIREIHSIEAIPPDPHYFSFIDNISTYYQVEPLHFIKRISHFLLHKKVETENNTTPLLATPISSTLTDEQQNAVTFLLPAIEKGLFTPTVLHGVTGSGKTEVYKALITHALQHKKTVLLLLPEVTLAIAFENRLAQELPHVHLYGFHSGKTPKEKQKVWDNLKNNTPMVLVGVHLPILLPIANLGLIIVDEEHETGYQEKKHPKINSKEAALMRAKHINIPIVLGSATPSISTLYNVKTKQWYFFQLKKRFSGAFPKIITVSLLNKKRRNHFWISTELEQAIQQRLKKKEQTIIFLNRRGVSFFVQCKQCSLIFSCKNCSVSLTLHDNDYLICHYCGSSRSMPTHCGGCKKDAHHFLKKGIGTQKIVTILQTMFPTATIARADLDTTTKKKVWQQTITNMTNGTIDILVGTQTIAKGFHFPRVTLVGIIWADLNLHFPLYNATETALQQLIQVAGRAGRNCANSEVIVQTMADHTLFTFLNEIDYLQYYKSEIDHRKELGYPPYKRLAEIELKHTDEILLEQEATSIANMLRTQASHLPEAHITILGPAKPPVAKIKDIYSRKIYCKADNFSAIAALYKSINKKQYKSSLFFTPNPV